MEPKINFIHICDYASAGDIGKVNILGIFENIITSNLPYQHPQFYIVSNVSVKKTGDYKQTIKITREEDKEIIFSLPETVFPVTKLPEETKEFNIGFMAQINALKFEKYGSYDIQIFVNGLNIGGKKFNLIKASQNN